MSALQLAVEAHVARQHQRVSEEDLVDSFPLDPDVFRYLTPAPPGVAPLVKQFAALNSRLGIGTYRGCFEDGQTPRLVVAVDTPGDVGFLVVLDEERLTPLCCARRQVERLTWISFDELLNELKTA